MNSICSRGDLKNPPFAGGCYDTKVHLHVLNYPAWQFSLKVGVSQYACVINSCYPGHRIVCLLRMRRRPRAIYCTAV